MITVLIRSGFYSFFLPIEEISGYSRKTMSLHQELQRLSKNRRSLFHRTSSKGFQLVARRPKLSVWSWFQRERMTLSLSMLRPCRSSTRNSAFDWNRRSRIQRRGHQIIIQALAEAEVLRINIQLKHQALTQLNKSHLVFHKHKEVMECLIPKWMIIILILQAAVVAVITLSQDRLQANRIQGRLVLRASQA